MAAKACPKEGASFFSRALLCWLIPLMKAVRQHGLTLEDLPQCPKEHDARKLLPKLLKNWRKQEKTTHPSLIKALFRTYGCRYICNMFLIFMEDCGTRAVQAVILGYLIKFVESGKFEEFPKLAYIYAAVLGILSLSSVVYLNRFYYVAQLLAMDIRVAISGLVYKKLLPSLPYVIIGPLLIAIEVVIIWFMFGPAMLTGFIFFPVFALIQGILLRCFPILRVKFNLFTDNRLKLVNDLISGMKVVKMYAAELVLAKSIQDARRKEERNIYQRSALKAINNILFYVSVKIIIFLTIIVCYLKSGELNANRVFVIMTLVYNLRIPLMFHLPISLSLLPEVLISLYRIQDFLLMRDKESNQENATDQNVARSSCRLVADKVCSSWNSQNSDNVVIKNISFSLRSGDLMAVIGPVGSGKTSLLLSLLGELSRLHGQTILRGTVAYASQEPWLFAGTLRDNIIFCSEFDSERYKRVIHAAALDRDLVTLPNGDQTLVGNRGVSLSGGQMARVNLARALYLDADIYLLDDPLSAVDARVANNIFQRALKGFLKNKLRILCTHQLQFIREANQILVLKDGSCDSIGDYNHFLSSGIEGFQKMDVTTDSLPRKTTPFFFSRTMSQNSIDLVTLAMRVDEPGESPKPIEEQLPTGSVPLKVYWQYLRSGFSCFLLLVLFLVVVTTELALDGIDVFVKHWTDVERPCIQYRFLYELMNIFNQSKSEDVFFFEPINVTEWRAEKTRLLAACERYDRSRYLHIYLGVVLVMTLLVFLRSLLLVDLAMRAAASLHRRLLDSVISCTTRFFDVTPIGIILTRFSKDINCVDELLPHSVHELICVMCMVGGTLIVNMYINFWLTIPTLILIFVHILIFRNSMPTIRAAKRLDMIASSPLLSHLDTTVNGLSTIRAFQRTRTFENKFWDLLNCHTSSCFLNFASIRWMNIAIDSSCAIYVCIIIVILLVKSDFSQEGGSNIGLAISMTLILNRNVQSVVRCCIDTASYIISVERLLEYANLPDKEALDPPAPPPQNWPNMGMVEFRHVYMRYKKEDEPVLKDICLRFKSGEKIGVVGRTGAGKSSLITSLFRLAEPIGKIFIDGVATSDVGLKLLRRNISIIPQTPFLFTTTVRQNLDLFGEHDDKTLWDVLQEVRLKALVSGLARGLDHEIPEGGGSLSLGQRQLVCLARALLRRNRLLVLDEATANLDAQTDILIQKTIRDKFATCTVLTIAHRLQTIMDSDRILVMSDGRVSQFDTPLALLEDERGLFAKMVRDNGPVMARQLHLMARKAAMKRQDALDSRHPSIDETPDVVPLERRKSQSLTEELEQDDPCTKL